MKRGKFNNVKTVIDGMTFDSKGEAARYTVLKARQEAGEISDLKRQTSYRITVNGVKVCDYRPDFEYVLQDRTQIVEDFKSPATITPTFRLKVKLMKAVHGVDVKVVTKPGDA
ncbi:DUF1064 domain-containing protein [Brevundimonas sp. NPDC058933]|uniref:DUF1064 domain-containing protein n=1 Tax=Brevundimonas sp. NPDC058933 TaxID=3346673 RepID=UPI003BEEB8EB